MNSLHDSDFIENEEEPPPERHGERRKMSAEAVIKRWLVDWSAMVATIVGVISIVQFFGIPFPLVWASEFKVHIAGEDKSLQVLREDLSGVRLAIEMQSLATIQREIRARLADRESLRDQRKPIPDYLENLIGDLQNQEANKRADIQRLQLPK